MYISEVHIQNYRCISDCKIELNPKLSIVVGENNIGKSNLLSALSLIFSPDASNNSRRLQSDDIWNGWRQLDHLPIVRVKIILTGFQVDEEKALVAKWLINSPNELKAQITYEYRPVAGEETETMPDALPMDNYEWVIYGGEIEREKIDFRDLGQIRLELLHALRDAEREIALGGHRRFGRLISRFKTERFDEESNTDKQRVQRATRLLNKRLERTQPVADAQAQLNQRLESISGLSNKQDATFVPSDLSYDDLIKNLQVFINNPGQQPHNVELNGLGYNNLLYISALLTDFYKRRTLSGTQGITLPIVAIEEPEAHLHPHLQKFLNYYFANSGDGQVIVTTHSTHIASSVSPEHIVALYRDLEGNICATNVGKSFPNNAESRRNFNLLRRHLDATKSTLFFARSVLLVEGLSEALLVPIIAKYCFDIDLDDKGVSIVSVHGTSFLAFIELFGPAIIRKKCAVLADSDPPPDNTVDPPRDRFPLTTQDRDYQPNQGIINLQSLMTTEKPEFVQVFTNLKTLEHDLIVANSGNRNIIENALDLSVTLSTRITQPKVDIAKSKTDIKEFSQAVLATISEAKGAFAQALAEQIVTSNDPKTGFLVPDYIKQAFAFLGLIQNV